MVAGVQIPIAWISIDKEPRGQHRTVLRPPLGNCAPVGRERRCAINLSNRKWYPQQVPRSLDSDISAFLAGSRFAVAGASASRQKFGNCVLRCYWQHGRIAYPVNPTAREIEGVVSYPTLAALPGPVHGVSLITQPAISERIVDEGLALGIRNFWFQPGSEHPSVIERAREADSVVIAGGPCILIVLGFDAWK